MPDNIRARTIMEIEGYALYVESAADRVGANDTALSNLLYSGAVGLRLYAKKLREQNGIH